VTIANTSVHPSGKSAILASDSRAVDVATGAQHEVSKLWVLTRWQAVLVCRGLQQTSNALFCALNHHALDFDTAFDHMGAIAQHAQDALLKQAPLPAGVSPDEASAPNIVMVAWREGRVQARVWNGFAEGQFPIYDVQPGRSYLTPSDEAGEIGRMKCSTAADMETVARRQCEIFREQAAARGERPPAVGSWLHIAHISELGIRIERRCNLDEPARPRVLLSVSV
jgi:hypothetical protein